MSAEPDTLADALTDWLATNGLSLRQAAPRVGCSYMALYHWRHGVRPGAAMRPRLAAALGIDRAKLDTLIDGAHGGHDTAGSVP